MQDKWTRLQTYFILLLQLQRPKGQDWIWSCITGLGSHTQIIPAHTKEAQHLLRFCVVWTGPWLSLEWSAESSSKFGLHQTASLQVFYQNNFRQYCLPCPKCSCSAVAFLHCWSCGWCCKHCAPLSPHQNKKARAKLEAFLSASCPVIQHVNCLWGKGKGSCRVSSKPPRCNEPSW